MLSRKALVDMRVSLHRSQKKVQGYLISAPNYVSAEANVGEYYIDTMKQREQVV